MQILLGEGVNRSLKGAGFPRRLRALPPSPPRRERTANPGSNRGTTRGSLPGQRQPPRISSGATASGRLPSGRGERGWVRAGCGARSCAAVGEPVSPRSLRRARSGALGAAPGDRGCSLQGHALRLYSPHRRTHLSPIDFRWVAVDGDTSGNHSWAQRGSFLTNFLRPFVARWMAAESCV